jgi:hypothetical protein
MDRFSLAQQDPQERDNVMFLAKLIRDSPPIFERLLASGEEVTAPQILKAIQQVMREQQIMSQVPSN